MPRADREPGPIIDLPPPSPEVREAVEKYLIKLIARRALEEVGLLPAAAGEDPKPPRAPSVHPVYVSTATRRKLLRLTSRLARDGWETHAIHRDDLPTVATVLDEALESLSRRLRLVPRRRA